MKKTWTIVGIGVTVISAAGAAVAKVVYDKVKKNKADQADKKKKTGSLGLPDGAVNKSKAGLLESQLTGMGSATAENNDYPRITISDTEDFPKGRHYINTIE